MVAELTESNWDSEVLSSTLPVVVDFWAAWCAPCKMMAPTIDEIADELEGRVKVGKLNVDENHAISERYEIRGIPTVMIFGGGEVKDKVIGVASKEYLLALIEKHVNRGNGND